ncbi:hypothetical protein LH464_17405 [Neorhizobium sp. T786]|uniref:hypothetical protein n=1 Tax=Pseudorhizobium xiangyangii TaxID=2883104 RepID=UPI001D000D21|nr:hypothetical protein [Neorhizobium xiangyangii]MCB5204246.1 hypothetical protein [Neorhizobium xiangyangii]
MTAMSQARQPTEIEGVYSQAPMKGATTILQGAIVAVEAGLAVPGKTALALVVLGVAPTTIKNTGADGAVMVAAKRGTFKFFNLGADAITAGDVGKDAFLVDDQTVAKSNGTNTRSVAGKIIQVDSDGVFVRVGY